jgi:phosphoadenosine phosphosulfate reductase
MNPSELEQFAPEQLLQWALETFGDRFAVVTSFQAEGMVLVDMAARLQPGVRVVTIDTGRLPQQTFEMMEQVRRRYDIRLETVLPDAEEVERMVTHFGPNLFEEAVSYRRLCCQIRKVRPLDRKLAGIDAYAVGLRRDQTEQRADTPKVIEQDGKLKLSPLADWPRQKVLDYIQRNDVPVHPLYAAGYTSIGCAPCTRATLSGESERAGRWWWETDAASECGLHFRADGKVERTVDVLLREILTD